MKKRIALILGAVMMLTGSVSAAASENQKQESVSGWLAGLEK